MKIIIIAFLIFQSFSSIAQNAEIVELNTETGSIEGTLFVTDLEGPMPVVLIIAGSGPTDRDGNNPMMKNNSLKMLASELYDRDIASLRFDKRGIGESANAGISESELRFESYINDVTGWISFLKNDKRFSKIIIAGHSEGSLIGMAAANISNVDKFISIAGAGQPADSIIRQQLESQPAFILDEALPILDQLANGQTVAEVPPILNSLFRESVQPYLISWFKYDPQLEIAKLDIPVLIIQGDTDIQVNVTQAKLLADAKPGAQLKIIEGMNHVLKNSETDVQKNIATYSQPDLPINSSLINCIEQFINY